MRNPSYTPAEIIAIVLRRYDLERDRGHNHDEAVYETAEHYGADHKKTRYLIDAARAERRTLALLAAAPPGEAAEELVPDTFPAEWCA